MNDVDDGDDECEKHLILDKFTLELVFSELRHADRNLGVWQNYKDNGESGHGHRVRVVFHNSDVEVGQLSGGCHLERDSVQQTGLAVKVAIGSR